jgi:hypothetical protein
MADVSEESTAFMDSMTLGDKDLSSLETSSITNPDI